PVPQHRRRWHRVFLLGASGARGGATPFASIANDISLSIVSDRREHIMGTSSGPFPGFTPADGFWQVMDQLRGSLENRAPGQRKARGDVRAAILVLLAEEPMHGYQIIREIEARSRGAWKPSAGSVYPTLQLFADEGLVRVEE